MNTLRVGPGFRTILAARKKLPLIIVFSLCAAGASWAQRSAFTAQMEQFTHSLVAQLSAKTPKGSAIAIADFDNKDAAAGAPDLGFAVSEIVTQDFQRSGYFLVLEKKQLQQILKTMELQQSGLYDSDKAATIGKLIDAKYLMVGSITKTAGFYHVAVRIVEVETGSVILSDGIDLDAALLESAAEKYLPPRYRAFIGSSMSWFATTPNGLGTYSIGLALGEATRSRPTSGSPSRLSSSSGTTCIQIACRLARLDQSVRAERPGHTCTTNTSCSTPSSSSRSTATASP